MTYRTHIVGGVCAALFISLFSSVEYLPVVCAVSGFSALLPDIDHTQSKLGRKTGSVSRGLANVFGHRGFIHTPILYLLLYMILTMMVPEAVSRGFFIGTLSHLLLDSFNYKGIMWLFPFSDRHFHIMSIATRGFGEIVFAVAMVLALIACMLCQAGILRVFG